MTAPAPGPTPGHRRRGWWYLAAGLTVALALAFFVSPHASTQPDGLNKVAIDEGFAGDERTHALADTPTAGYGLGGVDGVDDEGLGTGLAGIIGVALTFGVMIGLVLLVRMGRGPGAESPDHGEPSRTAATAP